MPPLKILAYLNGLCFETRCANPSTVAHFKIFVDLPKILGWLRYCRLGQPEFFSFSKLDYN